MEFRKIVEEYGVPSENNSLQVMQVRMSDNLVNEKMIQIQDWKDQIDEGELSHKSFNGKVERMEVSKSFEGVCPD